MINLSNVKLHHSSLTNTIYLIRHGKDENLALDKREAEADVMSVLVEYMMHDAPNGSTKKVSWGDKQFEISVKPTKS